MIDLNETAKKITRDGRGFIKERKWTTDTVRKSFAGNPSKEYGNFLQLKTWARK
ncbi:MAG: hypothetical protein ACHQ1H_14655 [Nitrososphaerales archaeon]